MNDDSPWRGCPLAVVDVETTGLDPKVDRVIEIAVIHMQDGAVTDSFASLVNPDQEIPDEVVRITGIQPEQVTTAPRFATIAAEVRARLEGRVLVAYNLPFDRAFIVAELDRAGLDLPEVVPIDPLVFIRELHKNQGSKRLSAAAERLGINLENAHRAKDDAEVAGHVLYALAAQLPERLGDLRLLQGQWEQQQQNDMAGWKNRRGGSFDGGGVGGGFAQERGNALGPAYIYGDDTDPVRYMFVHLPDAGARRN
ncbi:MAG: 3'-5' exonuclease [Deltaproteobacteria bacterium HGW-Deltaproteobacteria-14]|jgi:DNA polymerase III epsilon subunit family exonuclease|nr:MAG: 3'-5' exonuclease [Deltaproteobacteria bacterium HGW-Deltaproteobacteria-14]